MGTLPKTTRLLTNYGQVLGQFDSMLQVGMFLGVSISDIGVVEFMGEPVHPHYIMKRCSCPDMEGFEKQDAIRDWCNYYLEKNLSRGYKIYRCL